MVTHRNLMSLFEATDEEFSLDEHDVWTWFHSHAFDFSTWEIWGALIHGAKIVGVSHAVSREPGAFAELLHDERVTVLSQTPSAFGTLVRAEAERGWPASALRYLVFGGEKLESQPALEWLAARGETRLINMYGITEITVHATHHRVTREDTRAIGRPLANSRAYLLDAWLSPLPVGVVGEIYIAGGGVARGYHGDPERTAERFLPDPFGAAGERMYRTGDLGRMRADGVLEFLGRRDGQVKVRGHRIELGEIEAALREHPLIEQAAVVVRDHDEGDRRLTAYLVARAPIGAQELRAAMTSTLPPFMVPQHFVFVPSLPLTPNGKLDRRALPSPAPVVRTFTAPRPGVEQLIAEI